MIGEEHQENTPTGQTEIDQAAIDHAMNQTDQSGMGQVSSDPAQPTEVAAEVLTDDGTDSSLEQLVEELVAQEDGDQAAAPALQDLADAPDESSSQMDAEVIASFQSALAARDKEIQSLKAEIEGQGGQYARIAADFDNFRKRTQREREEMESQIKCSTLSELLPVVDNFDRARTQIQPKNEGEETIQKSYQSLYKQLVDCLKRTGVTPMRAEGKEFDPNLHEAVLREPTNAHPDGTVLEELQRGYLLGDRVLRHAMVKVAVATDEPPAAPAEG